MLLVLMLLLLHDVALFDFWLHLILCCASTAQILTHQFINIFIPYIVVHWSECLARQLLGLDTRPLLTQQRAHFLQKNS